MIKTALRPLRLLTLAWLISLVLAACGGPSSQPHQTITVSGAFAIYPLMTQWAEVYQDLHPDVRIDVTAGGAGKGLSDTLAGAVDIGMVSRELVEAELSQGAFPVAVARDAVFGTVSTANPHFDLIMATGFTPETLAGIYISGEITTWGQALGRPEISDELHIFTRSDSAGAAEMWAAYIAGKKQEDLLGIGVNADPGILEAVVKDPLGIGYNNLNYVYDPESGLPVTGVAVMPLDVNANGQADPGELLPDRRTAMQAVADGRYPSPPARDLYLVTKGAPGGETLAFLQWILTDGQAFVDPTGYISLSPQQIEDMRALLGAGQ